MSSEQLSLNLDPQTGDVLACDEYGCQVAHKAGNDVTIHEDPVTGDRVACDYEGCKVVHDADEIESQLNNPNLSF